MWVWDVKERDSFKLLVQTEFSRVSEKGEREWRMERKKEDPNRDTPTLIASGDCSSPCPSRLAFSFPSFSAIFEQETKSRVKRGRRAERADELDTRLKCRSSFFERNSIPFLRSEMRSSLPSSTHSSSPLRGVQHFCSFSFRLLLPLRLEFPYPFPYWRKREKEKTYSRWAKD